jgi:hypothetical protein
MTAVKFIRDHDRYMRGEVAGFRPTEAQRLVRRKIARLYRTDTEMPLAIGGQPPEVTHGWSAAELLASIDTPEFDWHAFQREARALVGEDAPRDKAGLIKALQGL